MGVVGGVTSDVFGVGSSWPGPGAGSGECDRRCMMQSPGPAELRPSYRDGDGGGG